MSGLQLLRDISKFQTLLLQQYQNMVNQIRRFAGYFLMITLRSSQCYFDSFFANFLAA